MGEARDGPSPAFRRLHEEIGKAVAARFPGTEAKTVFGMAAWVAPVVDPPAAEDWKGTMPRTEFVVGPTEKKAGITVHVWHPSAPSLVQDNAGWLQEAGFKPMVGCLQWNRKAPFPMDAFQRLLDRATGV